MIGNAIAWVFDLIGRIWEGFWNVCGRLFGLVAFTAACGVAGAAFLRLADPSSHDGWLYFKGGATIGFIIGAIRLLINEVGVPMVHAQEERERQRKKKEIDQQLARERAKARQEDLSRRLKTLN